jgi:hypothetical protein
LNILSNLLFLPSITFGLLTAEIFPWAVIYSVIYTRTLNKYILYIIGVLLFSVLLTLSNAAWDGRSNTDVIRSFAAYANILLIFQCMLYLSYPNILKLISTSKIILFLLLGLGLLQYIGFNNLGWIIKLLVPRGEGMALLESGRGVTLLATEPARAGIELTLIYLIARMTVFNKNNFHAMDLFIVFYQIVVIQSTSAVAFSIIAITMMLMQYRKNNRIIFVFFLLAIISIIFFNKGRASLLFSALLQYNQFSDALLFLVDESGNRLLALYAFVLSGFYHLFGQGVGNWQESSIIAILESGFDYQSIRFFDIVSYGELSKFRGPGIVSNLILDIGILGLIAVCYLFFKSFKRLTKGLRVKKVAILIFLFKIMFFGSPGNPIPLIMLALILRYDDEKYIGMKKTYFRPSYNIRANIGVT